MGLLNRAPAMRTLSAHIHIPQRLHIIFTDIKKRDAKRLGCHIQMENFSEIMTSVLATKRLLNNAKPYEKRCNTYIHTPDENSFPQSHAYSIFLIPYIVNERLETEELGRYMDLGNVCMLVISHPLLVTDSSSVSPTKSLRTPIRQREMHAGLVSENGE